MRRPTHTEKAELLIRLATLLDAGFAVDRALATCARETRRPASAAVCARTAELVARGRELAAAGLATGLLNALDAALVAATWQTGRAAQTLHRLGDYHRELAEARRRVLGQLLLPGLFVAVAVVVAPLPALVAGRIARDAYLLQTVSSLAVLGAIAFVVVRTPEWLRAPQAPLGVGRIVDWLLLKVPVLGRVESRRNVARWARALSLLVEAGVPLSQAVDHAADTMSNTVLRAEFERIAPRLAAGQGVEQALHDNPYAAPELRRLTASGEQSGRLPELLEHFGRQAQLRVQRFDQAVVVWLPRLFYLLAVGWSAWLIVQQARLLLAAEPL